MYLVVYIWTASHHAINVSSAYVWFEELQYIWADVRR